MDSKPQMLVVDDLEINRAVLIEIFKLDFIILEAVNGKEALSVLWKESNKIDIILLDIYMPLMNGFELLEKLRENPEFSKIPVIVNTQFGEDENQIRALSLGATDFISKPYNSVVIRQRVKNIMTKTVLERQRLEQNLEDINRRLQSLIDSVPGGIAIYQVAETIHTLYYNDTICALSGHTKEEYAELIRVNALDVVYEEDRAGLIEAVQHAIVENHSVQYTYRIYHKAGGYTWVYLSAVKFEEQDGYPIFHAVLTDMTENKWREEQLQNFILALQYRIQYDTLTGIYNRETFYRETQKMLHQNQDTKYALLRWNIANFKVINELFGTEIGDKILKEIAVTLCAIVEKKGIYGRLEADNFAVCIPIQMLEEQEFLMALQKTPTGMSLNYNFSIYFGIYEIEDIDLPVDQMCDRAALALRTVKGNFMKRFAYYDESMRQTLLREQRIINEMKGALERREFCIYLQPIYSITSGLPTSAEALVRWNHPENGLISPQFFIPIFEKNGFIVKLDHYVWEEACKYLSSRKKSGKPIVPISVNVSRLNLYNPHLCEDIIGLIQTYDLDSSLLKLEITETAYNDNSSQLLSAMETLQKYGFKIMMDDFGSGYSSLNMLKDVPVDVLKIDMKFIDDIDTSVRAASMMTSVIRMAKWMEMQVIAEGVETVTQLSYLRSIGCDLIQGYYFSKPLPLEKFDELLLKQAVSLDSSDTQEILEQFDFESIWQSNKEVDLLLNDMIDAMGIYELYGNVIEVVRVNDGYYKLFGGSPKTMFRDAKNILNRISKEDHATILNACHKAIETQKAQQYNVRRILEDGSQIWVLSKVKCIGGMGTDRALLYIIHNDVTAQKQIEQTAWEQSMALMNHHRFLQTLYDALPCGIIQLMLESPYKVVNYNQASYEIFNYPNRKAFADEINKDPFAVIHPYDRNKVLQMVTAAVENRKNPKKTIRTILYDGSIGYISVVIKKVNSYDGDLLVQAVFFEFGDEQCAKRECHRLLLKQSDTLIFDYGIKTQVMKYSIMTSNGQRKEHIIKDYLTYLSDSKEIHPQNREAFREILEQSGHKSMDGSIDIQTDYFGTGYEWSRVMFTRLLDAEGNPYRLIGIENNIHKEKKMQMQLDKELYYRNVLMDDLLFVYDFDLKTKHIDWIYQSSNYKKEFYSYQQYLSQSGNQPLLYPEEQEKVSQFFSTEYLLQLFRKKKTETGLQFRIKSKKGAWVWVDAVVSLRKGTEEDTEHSFGYIRIIDEQKQLKERVELDSYTGLLNRVAAEQKINESLKKGNKNCAFFLYDIDNFKLVNDTYGHAEGDKLIRWIAQVIKKHFRASDIVGRIGGDEFIVFIKNTHHNDIIKNKAEETLAAIQRGSSKFGWDVKISSSLGIAVSTSTDITFGSLYQSADVALYEAKNAGKDKFVMHINT